WRADRSQPAHRMEPDRRPEPADPLLHGEAGLHASRNVLLERRLEEVQLRLLRNPSPGWCDPAPDREVERSRPRDLGTGPDHVCLVERQPAFAGPRRADERGSRIKLAGVPRDRKSTRLNSSHRTI